MGGPPSKVCPICSEAGDWFVDAPRAELFHFSQRIVWGLHKYRQALDRMGLAGPGFDVGAMIRHFEEVHAEVWATEGH